jgi:O-antigen ligase
MHTTERMEAWVDRRAGGRLTWLSLLVASMPLCFAVSSHLKTLPMAVLVLAGGVLLLRCPEARRRYRLAWPVAVSCGLRLAYDLGNILYHRLGWDPLDLPIQTLLFLTMAAAFAAPLKERVVALGFSATTVVLGITCLVQRYGEGVARPYGLNGGEWAAVEFAMYLLVLTLLSLLQAIDSSTTRTDRWLHGIAVAIGLYGAVLTQSRGPLLAFAPVCVALLFWHGRRAGRWRHAVAILGFIVVGMLAVTASLQDEMVDRLADVQTQVATYSARSATGAVGERLEMWRVAWRAFVEHPLAGVGVDQFGPFVQAEVAAGRAGTSIASYVHPHSEYFESLVAGGLPALLVLLLFLGAPAWFFLHHLEGSDDPADRSAVAGLVVLAMYALCAFGDNVFYRAMPQSLFLFLVLGFSVKTGRQAIERHPHLQ